MKVPDFARPAAPVTLEDAAAELAARITRLSDGEVFLALERRLRPEEADELAGRPKGWAYREMRAGRLPFEKDPGAERPTRGRVGAVRIPVRALLAALEGRRVRPAQVRTGALAAIRSRHQTAAPAGFAS